MKLRQITENDEYTGLEDADEFGEESLGNCTQCQRDIPADTDGVWTCWDCEAVAHFSCAMPAQEDIPTYDVEPEGTMSSGWYFRRTNSSNPGSGNWNVLQRGRVLAAARAYDKYLCPACAQNNLSVIKMHPHSNQVTEDFDEYAGLEDADEFGGEDDFHSACETMDTFGQSLVDDLNSERRRPDEFTDGDNYYNAVWSEEDDNFSYGHEDWLEFMGNVYFDANEVWKFDWQEHA